MTFRIGQKVLCVDDRFRVVATAIPKKGEIYTIASFGLGSPMQQIVWGRQPAVTLAEIDAVYHREVIMFALRRFRPLVERKTDISIFTKLLDGSPLKIEAHHT